MRSGSIPQRLPNDLQRKLDFSHRHLGGREGAEVRNRSSVRGKRLEIVSIHCCEVGAIQNVEELSPELDIESLGNFPDVIVLNYGEIKVGQPWSNDGIAPQVAQKIDARQWI